MYPMGIQTVRAVITVVLGIRFEAFTGTYFPAESAIGLIVPDILKTILAKVPQRCCRGSVALAGEDFSISTDIGEIPCGIAGDIVVNVAVPAVMEEHYVNIVDYSQFIQLFFYTPECRADLGRFRRVRDKLFKFILGEIHYG